MEQEVQRIIEEELKLVGIQPINEGGQSYSFRSYDPTLNRPVFVKAYWYSEKYKDTLLTEPRRLSTLFNSNPNSRRHIANIYDVSNFVIGTDEYLFIKMEYCGDKNIGQLINDSSICLHDAINFAKQLCEGLHFLHSIGILHRDIKPENLMIDNGVCKLVDFGSTTNLKEGEDFIRETSIKTKNYTPPEYFMNERRYGKFSDIYQIGVVLHEMLNGRIVIDYSKIPKALIQNFERKIGKKLGSFDSWEGSEFENSIIEYYGSRNNFLIHFGSIKPYIPKKLLDLIKNITNFDYSKRPGTCVLLRNELSNIVVPNWSQLSEKEYFVSNWKRKNYRISLGKKNSWVLESATNNLTNYRKISSISTLESAIKYINSQK